MGHHFNRAIAQPRPSPRAVATFPAAKALTDTAQSRIQAFYGCPTWGGRAIPRWTRYGAWDEAGTELTVTRIL